MRLLPREPNPGEPITATWARELIRYLRAITPLAGVGTKLDHTPNGTRIHSSGGSGGGGGGSAVDKGCFALATHTADPDVAGDTNYHYLDNRYFMVGGKMGNSGNVVTHLEEFIPLGDLDEGETYTEDDKPFICLKVYAANVGSHSVGDGEITGYKELSGDDFSDARYYIRPLYKLSRDFGIVIDFRNMPELSMGEP